MLRYYIFATSSWSRSTEKKALLPEKKQKLIIEEDELPNIKEFINNFKKNGTNTLNQISANDFIYILRELTKAYHNQSPLLTDTEYDIIK